MVNLANDVNSQARQGSVAAIILILNEKLASAGIRTRAISANGTLQLLCEAEREDQLDQTFVVERVQSILEAIAPWAIRRVNLYGRTLREQQLLWFEEISRDPQNQLLWSQSIVLKKPNPLKQLADTFKDAKLQTKPLPLATNKPLTSRPIHRRPWYWLAGGASLGLLLAFAVGWIVSNRLGTTPDQQPPLGSAGFSSPNISTQPEVGTTANPIASTTPTPRPKPEDPFAEAVRIAEQAGMDGKTADTSAEWLDLAARWEQAAELMGAVPSSHERYAIAQDRTIRYRQNSELALREAEKYRRP